MSLGRRKLLLTTHITFTVGWLGAIAAFLAIAVAGLLSQDQATTQAAYLGMEVTGWFVIVPLSLGSLLTGLIQALATEWGLVRHYWILATFLINIVASSILPLFMQGLTSTEVATPKPVVHASAALALLFLATALSVFKPRGITPYGWRKQRDRRLQAQESRATGEPTS